MVAIVVDVGGSSEQRRERQVHVGDRVEVRVAAFGPTSYVDSFDRTCLTLEESGTVGAESTQYDWIWRATRPGTTTIQIVQSPGASYAISLDILPAS